MKNKELSALKFCWESYALNEEGKDKLIGFLFEELSKYRKIRTVPAENNKIKSKTKGKEKTK